MKLTPLLLLLLAACAATPDEPEEPKPLPACKDVTLCVVPGKCGDRPTECEVR